MASTNLIALLPVLENALNRSQTLGEQAPMPMLATAVQKHHTRFHMEYNDSPNILFRLLVDLDELGASAQHIGRVFQQVYPELTPLLQHAHLHLTEDTWQDYLGHAEYYRDYLDFFDQQAAQHGIHSTVERYFYNGMLSRSIGSQLQPLVHFAFGLQQDNSQLVTQGLAYLASTFVDASDLVQTTASHPPTCDGRAILFELASADQRFDGKFSGHGSFNAAVKVLLRSQADLLRMYMTEFAAVAAHMAPQDLFEHLEQVAIHLLLASHQVNQEGKIELDWFLGGGQLLESARAVAFLASHRDTPRHFIQSLALVQFLSMLCTYIVQGRPRAASESITENRDATETTEAIQRIVDSGDSKAILTLHALRFPLKETPHHRSAVHMLGKFVQKGIWIKGGIGWR